MIHLDLNATPKSPVVANSPSPDDSINVNSAADRHDVAKKALFWAAIEGGFDANLPPNASRISNAFPAALCNAQYMAFIAQIAPTLATVIPLTGQAGYLLVEGMLVPLSLVSKIKKCLDGETIEYRDAVDVEKLVGPEFIRTLTGNERKVVGHCVLHLIERGEIAIDFIGDQSTEEAA